MKNRGRHMFGVLWECFLGRQLSAVSIVCCDHWTRECELMSGVTVHHFYFMMTLDSQGWLCFRGTPEILLSCICQILQQSVFIDPVTTVQKYFRGLVLISLSCNFEMFCCEEKILICGVPTVSITACRSRGVRPPLCVHVYWWGGLCEVQVRQARGPAYEMIAGWKE